MKLFFPIFVLSLVITFESFGQLDTSHFVTTWKTNNLGFSNDSSIRIDLHPIQNQSIDIDWNNDGIFDTLGVDSVIIHQYNSPGVYTIRIRGNYSIIYWTPHSSFPFPVLYANDRMKLISLDQWGDFNWRGISFAGCTNMSYNPPDIPNLDSVKNANSMFWGVPTFNSSISNWNVSSITSMFSMFSNCSTFNQDLSSWDVSSVTNTTNMFSVCPAFNQDLSSWDMSSVTTMRGMFADATLFNQNIGNWDVSSVTNMRLMFESATSFNQDLRNWNVSSVTDMKNMFAFASSFNQNLGDWDISSLVDADFMLSYSNLSTNNYDSLLIGWDSNIHNLNIPFGVKGLFYCSGSGERSNLINDGWIILGDSLNCLSTDIKTFSLNPSNSINIYPNPNLGVFNIKLEYQNNTLEWLQILNTEGNLIHKLLVDKLNTKIDLSSLPNGLYFLVYNGISRKIIISK